MINKKLGQYLTCSPCLIVCILCWFCARCISPFPCLRDNDYVLLLFLSQFRSHLGILDFVESRVGLPLGKGYAPTFLGDGIVLDGWGEFFYQF